MSACLFLSCGKNGSFFLQHLFLRLFNQFELADGSSGWEANPRQTGAATWSRPKRCVQNKVVVIAPVVVTHVTHVTHVTVIAHVPHVTPDNHLSHPFLFSAF